MLWLKCCLSGISLRCLDSCLGKSQGADFVVTDNCLPFFLELGSYKHTRQSLLISWHRITGYLATVLVQDWDYKKRMGPFPKSKEALQTKEFLDSKEI